MRLQSHGRWLLALTLASQMGAGPPAVPAALPEVIVTRQPIFAIPFRIERSNDPAWQPVEAQLYLSTDRGAHWRQYTKASTTQNQFTFRAGADGEVWFAIRTADASGQARPAAVNTPGLRVLVDTKPPALKITAQPGKDGVVSIHWEIDEPNLKPNSLNMVYRPSPLEPWQAVAIDARSQASAESMKRGEVTFWPKPGSSDIPIRAEVSDTAGNRAVANARVRLDEHAGPRPSEASLNPRPTESNGAVVVAGKPAIGQKYSPPGAWANAAPTVPGLPPGERPRMVNSLTFDLEYEVDSLGPSGIGRVELWGTADRGQTWRAFTVDRDKRSPVRANVSEEGIYGFRVVVTNGSGFGGKPPVAGDQPDLWIGVDLTKPTARIVSAQQGVESEAGQLIISWQADDKLLAARPVTLSFSPTRGGPWSPIAAGLENTGRYAWPIDNRTPPQLFFRLEVRDEAGNVGIHESSEPVTIDQSRPTVRIRSVRPVSQPPSR